MIPGNKGNEMESPLIKGQLVIKYKIIKVG